MSTETLEQQPTNGAPAAAPTAAPAQPAAGDSAAVHAPESKPAGQVPEWATRRFAELTAARRAAEENAARLQSELDRERSARAPASGDPAAPTAPANANVQQLVETMARQQAQEMVRSQNLAQRVGEIESAGAKEFGADFNQSVQNLQLAGVGSPEFLEALISVGSPEKVVRYLGDAANIDEAMRLAALPPMQMAIELTKIAPKAVAAYSKGVSSAPAPITPLDGSGRPEGAEPDPKDTKAWMAWRSQNARKRR